MTLSAGKAYFNVPFVEIPVAFPGPSLEGFSVVEQPSGKMNGGCGVYFSPTRQFQGWYGYWDTPRERRGADKRFPLGQSFLFAVGVFELHP